MSAIAGAGRKAKYLLNDVTVSDTNCAMLRDRLTAIESSRVADIRRDAESLLEALAGMASRRPVEARLALWAKLLGSGRRAEYRAAVVAEAWRILGAPVAAPEADAQTPRNRVSGASWAETADFVDGERPDWQAEGRAVAGDAVKPRRRKAARTPAPGNPPGPVQVTSATLEQSVEGSVTTGAQRDTAAAPSLSTASDVPLPTASDAHPGGAAAVCPSAAVSPGGDPRGGVRPARRRSKSDAGRLAQPPPAVSAVVAA